MMPRLGDRTLAGHGRSEEHTSELQSLRHLVCRLLLEKKKLVEDGDLVAVVAHADAHERRADEAGATAARQAHQLATRAARYPSGTRGRSASWGAPRAERRTR